MRAYTPSTNWIAGHSNADGSAVLNQYDVLGRLTSISAANGSKVAINTYAYTYDAAGQRTQEASTVGTRDFNYDNQRQLTSAYRIDANNNPIPSYNYSYSFDAIGNWTKVLSSLGELDITSNSLNQYTLLTGSAVSSPQTPTYDADGNMLTDGKGNTYIYDEENRLVEADTPNASVAKTISVYDGLSRRVEKRTYNSGGTLVSTTRYLYDGLLPIAEYDANNNLVRSYTRGLDLSGTMQGAGGIGGLLAVTDSTGTYSYFTDGNGNITDLTNAYGTVVSHYEYDPFGNLVASTGTLQQNYQWSSKETDASTGLVYYLYRFYSPTLGRWINRDPIEENGGLNMYGFIVNNPVRIMDFFGLSGSDDDDDDDDTPGGAGAGTIVYLNNETPLGNGFYMSGKDPNNFKNNTSSFFTYKKSNPKKIYRLDYGPILVQGSPNYTKQDVWHHNLKGVQQALSLTVTNHDIRNAKLLGITVTIFKWGGRAAFAVGAAESALDIYHAEDKTREVVIQAGGWAGAVDGGFVGGRGGAIAGFGVGTFFFGPPGETIGATVGGAGGAVIFGAIGFWAGATVTKTVYDTYLTPLYKQEWEAVCVHD